jgi:hypothetical protein
MTDGVGLERACGDRGCCYGLQAVAPVVFRRVGRGRGLG